MTTTSTSRWRFAAAAGLLLLGALLTYAWLGGSRGTEFQLGSFTLVESASAATEPAVSRDVATEAARKQLAELNPTVRNLSLSGVHLAVQLRSVSASDGNLVYSSTKSEDSWVLEYDGPAQNGFQKVKALVVVDAQTGEVSSAQIMQSN